VNTHLLQKRDLITEIGRLGTHYKNFQILAKNTNLNLLKMKDYNLINSILPKLLSGDINKKECEDLILEKFSRYDRLHSDLKENEAIIYDGNSGILIKKGERKSIIKFHKLGRVENENTVKEIEIYNIEFYKEPKNYWK
jgi:hypothetical protein